VKKLLSTLIALLAINFLALAGGAGWLYTSGHLTRERAGEIKKVLFPPHDAEAPATQPTTADNVPSSSQRLAEMLAKHAGHSAAEQVAFIQKNFDSTSAQLDRREREVSDREAQVASANAKLVDDRKALEAERQKLTDQEQQSARLANDKGFQDTLVLYNAMASKQAKDAFMAMDDKLAAQYLDAMQPRAANKILKEFKTPDEKDRLKRIFDKMRSAPSDAATQPSKG
jgi:flagellar motility protein MotE (MotC chaperone)